MHIIEQSTSITIRIGPFVDDSDGKTAETGLTIGQADIRLSKNGGDFAQSNDSSGATHDEAGWYYLTLDATDTNTLGRLIVAIHESGALPVWREFMVVPSNVWDSLVGGTDKLDTNVTEISEDSTAADNLESYCDGGDRMPVDVRQYGDQALITGSVDDTTPGTEIIDTDLVNTTSGAYTGMLLMFTSGSLAGIIRYIAGSYTGSGSGATVSLKSALPSAPANNDEFILLPGGADHAFIADAIWEDTLSDHTSQATYAGWFLDTIYDKVATDGVVLADNAVSDAKVASDMDNYQAKVWLTDDDGNTYDRYVCVWFKNGEPVTSGITSPTIQVIKASDGSDLVGSQSMSQIASTGLYKYDESSNRISDGAAYIAKCEATIDGSTRTWYQPVSRDG